MDRSTPVQSISDESLLVSHQEEKSSQASSLHRLIASPICPMSRTAVCIDLSTFLANQQTEFFSSNFRPPSTQSNEIVRGTITGLRTIDTLKAEVNLQIQVRARFVLKDHDGTNRSNSRNMRQLRGALKRCWSVNTVYIQKGFYKLASYKKRVEAINYVENQLDHSYDDSFEKKIVSGCEELKQLKEKRIARKM